MNLEQFRDHLAANIGLKGRGNALAADDANYIETVIQNCQEELEQLGVSLWPLTDIPGYAVESFCIYCQATLSRFGFDPNPALKQVGLSQLRYVTADTRSSVGQADFF